jgi:hypothetical protein
METAPIRHLEVSYSTQSWPGTSLGREELEELADLIACRLQRGQDDRDPDERKLLVSVRQAADLLAGDLKTIYRHAEELGGRKVGGAWRFDLDAAAADDPTEGTRYASEPSQRLRTACDSRPSPPPGLGSCPMPATAGGTRLWRSGTVAGNPRRAYDHLLGAKLSRGSLGSVDPHASQPRPVDRSRDATAITEASVHCLRTAYRRRPKPPLLGDVARTDEIPGADVLVPLVRPPLAGVSVLRRL